MADAAALCLADQGHGSEVILRVSGEFRTTYQLHRPDVTDPMRGTYDLEEATELGACGMAILMMRDQTGLTVQRAFRGEGFDYWRGNIDEQRPFQQMARLEVSGIRHGDRRRVTARVKEKLVQVGSSEGTLAGYVVVVEFSAPQARVEKR
jgi:hypothetical protein